jgi:hypothetical protein
MPGDGQARRGVDALRSGRSATLLQAHHTRFWQLVPVGVPVVGYSEDRSSSRCVRKPYFLAERVRFELTSPVRSLRFSRPVQSTALPPLHSNRIRLVSLILSGTEAARGGTVSPFAPSAAPQPRYQLIGLVAVPCCCCVRGWSRLTPQYGQKLMRGPEPQLNAKGIAIV